MSVTEPVSSKPANGAEGEELRVSSLELFFDLVFVFMVLAEDASRATAR
jgi:low temperature requirement protein LtrA